MVETIVNEKAGCKTIVKKAAVKSTLLITIFCVLFNLAAVSPVFGQEADGLTHAKPLKVGDKIPDELWNLPLKVVNHPEGKEYIKLSDYRDRKLIILDFWGTSCASCILTFPPVKAIQDQYDKDIIFIPMATQPAGDIQKFIANNKIAQDVNLWSVVEENTFKKAIIQYTIPHFTWIADGHIISNTSTSAIKEKYMKDYLEKGTIGWGEKVNLNKKEPFLASLGNLSSSISSFYFEGYLDGTGKGFGSSPFRYGLINYFCINHSHREVYEWFLTRIARLDGKIGGEITYSKQFMDSDAWDSFNKKPISFQIIIEDSRSLASVFAQFRMMSSYQLEQDATGAYGINQLGKE